MARTIIAIRPEPGLSQTLETGRAMGLEIAAHPLFEIAPVEWQAPDPAAFDGLLIGSANAIRHGGPQLALLLDIPVYAVGKTTAKVAEKAGFSVAAIGQGGLQSLLDRLKHKAIRFLRLSGEDHIALNPPRSHTIEDRIVYRSSSVAASQLLAQALDCDPVVLLHSAIAAEHFAQECDRIDADRGRINLACLGPRIADAAGGEGGGGWGVVAVAAEPTDAALLAVVKNLCK